MSNYLHEHSRESGKESRKTRGVKRGRKGSERCNMHRETRKQPASSFFFLLLLSLFFFFFSFTSTSMRVFHSFKFSYSKASRGKKKSRENPCQTFWQISLLYFHTSNFNSSNLNLRYLFHFEKKKICNSIWKRRKGNVRRRVLSFPSKIDHPAFSLLLFSPPFVPSSHPRDIESRFYGALARRGKARGVNFYSRI